MKLSYHWKSMQLILQSRRKLSLIKMPRNSTQAIFVSEPKETTIIQVSVRTHTSNPNLNAVSPINVRNPTRKSTCDRTQTKISKNSAATRHRYSLDSRKPFIMIHRDRKERFRLGKECYACARLVSSLDLCIIQLDLLGFKVRADRTESSLEAGNRPVIVDRGSRS